MRRVLVPMWKIEGWQKPLRCRWCTFTPINVKLHWLCPVHGINAPMVEMPLPPIEQVVAYR